MAFIHPSAEGLTWISLSQYSETAASSGIWSFCPHISNARAVIFAKKKENLSYLSRWSFPGGG
jgi:hypothetical protein